MKRTDYMAAAIAVGLLLSLVAICQCEIDENKAALAKMDKRIEALEMDRVSVGHWIDGHMAPVWTNKSWPVYVWTNKP